MFAWCRCHCHHLKATAVKLTRQNLRLQSPSCCSRIRSSLLTTIAQDEYEQYRHLSDDVLRLIQRENERTRQSIDQTLKDEIAQEILTAYKESLDEAVPELGPTGKYQYTVEESNGRRQYYRERVDSVLLEERQLVLDVSFREYQVLAMTLSVDEACVAYLVSPIGSPSQTMIWIRHLDSSGTEFAVPTNEFTVCNVEWGPLQLDGSHSLFFVSSDDKGRPSAVHACCVSPDGDISPSRCIYQNLDQAVMVDVQRTKGCQYVAIYASTKTSSEVRLLREVNQDTPLLVRRRQDGVLYHVDVGTHNDVFLLAHAAEPQHNSGLLQEMTLLETTLSSLPLQSSFGSEHQCSVDDEYVIGDMDVFSSFVALYERSAIDGRYRIRLQMRSNENQEADIIIPLPPRSGDCAVLSSAGNMYYESTCLHFRIESPCRPGRTHAFDTVTREVRALSHESGNESFVEKRVLVTSDDGSAVPLSYIYLEDDATKADGGRNLRPALLIGYGAYGEPVVKGFDPTIVPLLNRGFVIAYAHTRGGGELGRAWYRAGRAVGKERVVDDFLACAKALVGSLAISEPNLLTAKAFSAGGVAVAAAMNRQPSLFCSVVLTNPFLDVTTSMANTDLALTEHEWDEWGNVSRDDNAARSISRYCPMSNISSQEYPKLLLVGTIDDSNVPYWHPLTFYLKLRGAMRHCATVKQKKGAGGECIDERALLRIELSGGHQLHGAKLDVAATEASFIIGNQKTICGN